MEKLKSSARQGAFISDKINNDSHPAGAMDGNPGGSKVSEGMSNKDKWGGRWNKRIKHFSNQVQCISFFIWVFPHQSFSFPMK
jgi:hypothetical protein